MNSSRSLFQFTVDGFDNDASRREEESRTEMTEKPTETTSLERILHDMTHVPLDMHHGGTSSNSSSDWLTFRGMFAASGERPLSQHKSMRNVPCRRSSISAASTWSSAKSYPLFQRRSSFHADVGKQKLPLRERMLRPVAIVNDDNDDDDDDDDDDSISSKESAASDVGLAGGEEAPPHQQYNTAHNDEKNEDEDSNPGELLLDFPHNYGDKKNEKTVPTRATTALYCSTPKNAYHGPPTSNHRKWMKEQLQRVDETQRILDNLTKDSRRRW
eukprot:CAMPEP_0116843546 /NCGR_PEP_ID=MMETSP0418-20121206/12149_1 /TAXON_ID=1158023 /ORGANISM="Astrosyne radiata, Strain 13vi08-1A" /LENGTH=271 /DNA_ID=CAMNT_0004474313 /DNA_START=45 /DNA_END=860 /DNA_ORIENTATION=+